MIQVVAAAIFKENLLMACKRAPGKHLAGFWEFPGGKVELGETKIYALEREIFEELGIKLLDLAKLSSTHDKVAGIGLDVFISQTEDDPKLTDAHDEIRWLRFSEINQINWAPLDRAAVECLRKNDYAAYWGGS